MLNFLCRFMVEFGTNCLHLVETGIFETLHNLAIFFFFIRNNVYLCSVRLVHCGTRKDSLSIFTLLTNVCGSVIPCYGILFLYLQYTCKIELMTVLKIEVVPYSHCLCADGFKLFSLLER
jgi:hypothetical protein